MSNAETIAAELGILGVGPFKGIFNDDDCGETCCKDKECDCEDCERCGDE